MKPIKQIATETGVPYDVVYVNVKFEGILTKKGTPKLVLTQTQEDHILRVLFFKRYFKFLTLESKINLLE